MSLIHVCSCILCSFNGEVFKYREEKEKLALFPYFLLAFLSLQIVTLQIIYKSWAVCKAVHFEDGASFFSFLIFL